MVPFQVSGEVASAVQNCCLFCCCKPCKRLLLEGCSCQMTFIHVASDILGAGFCFCFFLFQGVRTFRGIKIKSLTTLVWHFPYRVGKSVRVTRTVNPYRCDYMFVCG